MAMDRDAASLLRFWCRVSVAHGVLPLNSSACGARGTGSTSGGVKKYKKTDWLEREKYLGGGGGGGASEVFTALSSQRRLRPPPACGPGGGAMAVTKSDDDALQTDAALH
ncbi:hypothetical protein EYF80_051854 [Liparis tanakae]|uniref:Uncharacterized protein n=1 Tax=Liparis tanakae TaxID=230148 RepID=A0A4Z2FAL0_9TELE|nr:hypothetical protein EYF80_051854 [Liparis tanakae]